MSSKEGEEKKETEAAPEVESKAPKAPKGPLIVALVNTLAVLGVLGLLVYTRMIYKKPQITEAGERQRLASLHASPTPPAAPGLIVFDAVTVNIESMPAVPKAAEGTARQIEGKLHYVTVGFAIEIRDINKKDQVDILKPIIMDKLLSMLGRKSFSELTTVQGRYILRTHLLDVVNQLLTNEPTIKSALATNLFFTNFIVQ